MEVLKLSTKYFGRTNVTGHVIMPINANGVVFGYLPEDEIFEAHVNLGVIDNNECYGDLYVEVVDLSLISASEAQKLVENSNFEMFKSFFKEVEGELEEYIKELKEEEFEEVYEIEKDESDLYASLGVLGSKFETKSQGVYKAFMNQLENFMENKKTTQITILASDLTRAQALLLDNGIKII